MMTLYFKMYNKQLAAGSEHNTRPAEKLAHGHRQHHAFRGTVQRLHTHTYNVVSPPAHGDGDLLLVCRMEKNGGQACSMDESRQDLSTRRRRRTSQHHNSHTPHGRPQYVRCKMAGGRNNSRRADYIQTYLSIHQQAAARCPILRSPAEPPDIYEEFDIYMRVLSEPGWKNPPQARPAFSIWHCAMRAAKRVQRHHAMARRRRPGCRHRSLMTDVQDVKNTNANAGCCCAAAGPPSSAWARHCAIGHQYQMTIEIPDAKKTTPTYSSALARNKYHHAQSAILLQPATNNNIEHRASRFRHALIDDGGAGQKVTTIYVRPSSCTASYNGAPGSSVN